jgi:hypothetical protein
VYFVAVLLAVGLLFAITAVPGNSAELFPEPNPDELMQAVQWMISDRIEHIPWTSLQPKCAGIGGKQY